LWAAVHVRDVDAERGREIDLVILLLGEDLADLFGERVFSERLALADAVAIIADGLVFIVEIELKHSFASFDVRTGFGVTTGILPR
jgi:hypothetical protein